MNLIDDSRLRQEHTVLRKTLANLVAQIDDFGYGHLGVEMDAARNLLVYLNDSETTPKPLPDGGRSFDEAVDRVIARVDSKINTENHS
jgi:hypothetical protein